MHILNSRIMKNSCMIRRYYVYKNKSPKYRGEAIKRMPHSLHISLSANTNTNTETIANIQPTSHLCICLCDHFALYQVVHC